MRDPNALPPRNIKVSGLTVRRGGRVVLDDIGFGLVTGGVLLLRGPNGAGKSTLLLTLCGMIRADAGRIEVFFRDEAPLPAGDLHLLGHQSGIKPQLTLAENLRFWADVYAGTSDAAPAALAEVGLGGLDDVLAAYLSAGQTRRLSLARLLVAERPIWLLDEPTAALDAEGEALVARMIDRHAGRGGLTIAATHHDLRLGLPVQSLLLGAGP